MKSLKEVCSIMGISRRALQGYASKDLQLLLPTEKRGDGEYWYYDEDALIRLTFIQIFVEAGYTRKEIKKELDKPNFDMGEEIPDLIKALEEKKARIEAKLILLQEYELMAQIIRENISEMKPEAVDDNFVRQLENPHSLKGNPFSLFANMYVKLISDEDWNSLELDIKKMLLGLGMTIGMIGNFAFMAHESKLIQTYVKRLYVLSKTFFPWFFNSYISEGINVPWSEEDIHEIEKMAKNDMPEYIQFFQANIVDLLKFLLPTDARVEQYFRSLGIDYISYLNKAVKAFQLNIIE